MKLPVIKHLTQFIEANDEDYIVETLETLEALTGFDVFTSIVTSYTSSKAPFF